MRNFRKMIAAFSMVAILSTLVVSTAFAGTYTDVPETSGYYTAVEALAAAGVLDATNTVFNGTGSLKRSQGAKMAVLAAGMTEEALENPAIPTFKDVGKVYWGYKPIETAVSMGIINGYSDTNGVPTGYFGPDATLTKAHYAKMLVEALGLELENPATPTFTDVPKANWAYVYVETAVAYGLTTGATTTLFGGSAPLTRFAAADMTHKGMGAEAPADDEEEEEDGELEGGAGSIESFELLASYSNEEVGEGEADVIVYGAEIEADSSSDLGFTAFNLDFDWSATGTAADRDFERYATEVSIWMGDEELARVDADEFNDDNLYKKTVSFDEMGIVRAGEKEKFYVKVSGVSNLDSADDGEGWDVAVDSARFQDGQGAIITDTSGDMTTVVRFTFETFATAAGTELKFSAGDEAINDAHVVDVSSTGDTDDVEILSFKAQVKGDSDLTVDDVVVEFTLANSTLATDLNDIVSTIYLSMDGDVVGTENATTDETVTFDNMGLTLEAGETYEFVVLVDVLEYDAAGTYDEGDTLGAKLTTTERNLWDIEDEEGEDLANGSRTGAVTGDEHAFYDEGIMVDLVSVSKTKTSLADPATSNSVDSGTFEVSFNVTAFGDDQYIDLSGTHNNTDATTATDPAAANGNGVLYDVFFNGVDTATGTASANYSVSGALVEAAGSVTGDGTAAYIVKEGTTRKFTFSVVVAPAVEAVSQDDGQYEIRIDGITWGNANGTTDSVAATANVYNFNLDEFKTGNLYLQEID